MRANQYWLGCIHIDISAYNKLAVHTGTLMRPYGVDQYAANGKIIRTFRLAEHVKFQLRGFELETNVVVDDSMAVEDFLLRRNFLRTYHVLVDLTAMKVITHAPSRPVWYHAHTHLSNESLFVLLHQQKTPFYNRSSAIFRVQTF